MTNRMGLVSAGLVVAVALAPRPACSLTVVPVYVNGERLDANALIAGRGSRTLLPLRALFHALDARVVWDGKSGSVYAWKPDGQGLRFGIGQRQVQLRRIEGEPGRGNWGKVTGTRPLDAPPLLIAGTVYIPLRAAGEALRAEVRWDPAEKRVLVNTDAQPEAPPEKPAAGLSAVLELPKERFAPGEAVPLKLVVKNGSAKPVTAGFTTGQRFDFEARRNGQVAWSWARGRMFIQSLGSVTFQPGESKSFEARWDGTDGAGKPVAEGSYTLRGFLAATEPSLRAAAERPVTIGR